MRLIVTIKSMQQSKKNTQKHEKQLPKNIKLKHLGWEVVIIFWKV